MLRFIQKLIGRTSSGNAAKPHVVRRFSSVDEAAAYIGKTIIHKPVEMPDRKGILLAVEANGILVVGDWTYRCWYWQCQPV